MASLFRKVLKYAEAAGRSLSAKSVARTTAAEAKLLLTEAITDAQNQHQKLKAQVAKVISNHRQTETRLNRALDELEKLTRVATQAVLLADKARSDGDAAQMNEYTRLAENFANRMVGVDSEVGALKELHLQTSQAANQAQIAVDRNAIALRRKLAERQRLLSQLDQAEMQEQVNTALSQLAEQRGGDTPTLEEVRSSIEQRYAKALGAAAVSGTGIEAQALDIERAAMEAQANARLAKLREQLGLPKQSD